MEEQSGVLILGHTGLVGSAMLRLLSSEGFKRVISPGPGRIDLRDQEATRSYFERIKPNYVVMAAGKVGGIAANSTYPYDFIYDNLIMAANVVDCCRQHRVEKLLMLGSTCIYPRLAAQPIREESLLAGPLEPTNEWYAVAKIAGIKLGQAARRQHGLDVIAAMPTNLYGPNDNFDPQSSHVLPAMIRNFHEAKVQGRESVTIWGSGAPRREFLHVDDLSRALLLLLKEYSSEDIVNVGCGVDISIAELAQLISDIVGFKGQIQFDRTRPDGTPKKQTDISRISALGWSPLIGLREGIQDVYRWYLASLKQEAIGLGSAHQVPTLSLRSDPS